MRRIAVLALISACSLEGPWFVKGNVTEGTDAYVGTGGTLPITGCNYPLTTVYGADPPSVSTSFFGTDPTPRIVHLGVIGDLKTSMVAQWRTNDETTLAGVVRYAAGANLTADQLTQTATGVQFGFKGTGMQVYRQHQAHMCGLSAGTTYSYQVGSVALDGTQYFSPIYSFHTAPDIVANPDSEVVLGFVGDSRGGYDVWQQLIQQLQMRTPDLVLFSGDAVTIGITQLEWETFFGNAESLFATVPVISADGNHEDNAVNYYSQMALPGDQQNFGVDYGYAHITVANDSPEDPNAITGAFHDAISADFTASDAAQWKLFMHHQPMFSASTKHGSSTSLQQAWEPLIDAHHIDLVLNGHDHDYEVTKPLVAGAVVTGASTQTATVYVVAGGAGAELYPNGTQDFTNYSESTYSAAILHVGKNMMTMDAFRPDGTMLPTGFAKSK